MAWHCLYDASILSILLIPVDLTLRWALELSALIFKIQVSNIHLWTTESEY